MLCARGPTPAHLSRLALIEDLQHQGLTLAAIERYLERLPADLSDQDLALHRALVAAWVPDAAEETSRAELERRAGRPLTTDLLRETTDLMMGRVRDQLAELRGEPAPALVHPRPQRELPGDLPGGAA